MENFRKVIDAYLSAKSILNPLELVYYTYGSIVLNFIFKATQSDDTAWKLTTILAPFWSKLEDRVSNVTFNRVHD